EKLNIKFGKVKPEDFDVQSKLIDSSTNAVVVADVGTSKFIASKSDVSFSLLHTQKKRIKLIHKNGFNAATVSIPLFVGNNNAEEKLENLDATTYNLENGKVVETKVPKSSVFTERSSKNWIIKKFTFPAIKEGSIIEYSYSINSDFFFNLQPWTFQGEYPVLWSQYEAAMPDFYKFVTISQGYHPFLINKFNLVQHRFSFTQKEQRENIGLGGFSPSTQSTFNVDGNTKEHIWVMKDVPALKEEAFTTTVNNSVAKIEFQLSQIAYPNTVARNVMSSWEKTATDLMDEETFGAIINRPNNWLNDDVKLVVGASGGQLEKAKKILAHVRDNYTHNGSHGIYSTKNLKDVVKSKNGSVADLNLLLIAMLKAQDIKVNPVILSTRGNGVTHEYYPLLNRYNYVIGKATIDGTDYYLDATAKQLDFGKLPIKLYNGHAREITRDNAVPVHFAADSLREVEDVFIYLASTEDGAIQGKFKKTHGNYESHQLRNTMSQTSLEEYTKSIKQQYPEEMTVANIQVDSLKSLKDPVVVQYDLKINSFNDEDVVYFNPVIASGLKKNPFTAAQRFYPVEMPYTFTDQYNLTMQIPKGYKVEELPKSVRYKFNETEGMFEYLISADKETISLRRRLVMNRATFVNEDYQYLRDLYSFVVKKDSEQIVFKKIK
ncbi:MAG: DUF3857 domain-containing protein, partial [Chitinophagaceae bacterium]